MNRKPIAKETRIRVYQKYDGHCAYCGSKIEYKDMQVDHIHSVRGNEMGYDMAEDDYNSIGNLLPSCRSCNYYKGANPLEVFRSQLKTLNERLDKVFIYRLAKKFGMVKEIEWDGKFYFEREENQAKMLEKRKSSEND